MARSQAKGRAPALSANTECLKLLDLPCALLEIILLLLPLKLRLRFSTTCRTARQLVSSSSCLFPEVSATCRSRMQTLVLLRWLGRGGQGTRALFLRLSVQRVPVGRQLGQGIGMQGALLEALFLRSVDGPLVLDGTWLASLVRLEALTIQACAVEFGSHCGQLAALRDLTVQNGFQVPSQEPYARSFSFMQPGTVAVQPGAIPAGLTSMSFSVCAMPELPSALCAATGLKELRLEHCPQSFGHSSWNAAALLEGTLGCFTALETLQLRLLRLQDQPNLPILLAGLTSLQHLGLTESLLCDGGEQALCSALPQLSSLTSLSLGSLTSPGRVQVAANALPNLRELRRVLPEAFEDQSLELVAAAPRLQSLMVGAGSLLHDDHNLQLLRKLPDLHNLAVVLPTRDSTWEEVDASWVACLVDALTSLPTLDYALLLFGDDEMEKEPHFYGLGYDLYEHGLVAVTMSESKQLKELDKYWPALDGFAQRYRQLWEAQLASE